MAGVGIAGAATGLNEMAGQLQGLVSYADSLKTIFLIVAIGGIALAAYARLKTRKTVLMFSIFGKIKILLSQH